MNIKKENSSWKKTKVLKFTYSLQTIRKSEYIKINVENTV